MADQQQPNIPAYTVPEIKVHVMARKYLYFAISGLIMLPGIIAMIICMQKFGAPVKPGIDFVGGSLLQLRFEQKVEVDEFRSALKHVKIGGHHLEGEIQEVIETGERTASSSATGGSSLILRTRFLVVKPADVAANLPAVNEVKDLKAALAAPELKLGMFETERVENVGPKIGAELLRNALIALGAGIVCILGYIAFRYQFDFAFCAIAAMVHDIIVMIGAFAIMCLTLGAEADGLLVTALLTVMGFSVHDTIVIFDRFRENLRYAQKGDTFADIADRSINQTFVRSINTSATVALTLLPLVVFGGSSIFFFSLTILIGVISGTYSSIFNAAPLLVLWRDGVARKGGPVEGAATPAA